VIHASNKEDLFFSATNIVQTIYLFYYSLGYCLTLNSILENTNIATDLKTVPSFINCIIRIA